MTLVVQCLTSSHSTVPDPVYKTRLLPVSATPFRMWMTGSDTNLVSQPETGNHNSYAVSSRLERINTPLNHFQPNIAPQLPFISTSGSPTDFQHGNDKMESSGPIPQVDQPQIGPKYFMSPLPLPPPPLFEIRLPPPPEFTAGTVPSHTPVVERHAFAERIDLEQEELRDSRDEVLGSRFRLQAKRNELRDLREETGAKDGSVFNLLRRYLHESNVNIPRDIEEAFNEASSLRDRLGILEAEYDEAEINYNRLEWNYTRKESHFVEALVDNNLVPNSTLERTTNDLKTPDSKQHSGELPSTWPGAPHLDGNDPGTDLVLLAGPHNHNLTPPNHAVSNLRRGASLRSNHSIARSTRRFSENNPPHARSAWLAKLKRIDDWLLEMISESPVQKAHLRALHYLDYLDDNIWWKQVEQNWSLDTVEAPIFHTGDSTVSHRVASQHISTSTVDIMGSESSVVKDGNSMPLLSGDRNLDALEAASRPTSIKAGDLSGSGIDNQGLTRRRTIATDEITMSVSTGQSRSRRTSSSGGHETSTSLECACGDYIRHATHLLVCRRERFDGTPRSRNDSDQDDQSAPATPTQRGQNENSPAMPRMVSDSVDQQPSEHSAQMTTSTMSNLLGTPPMPESIFDKLSEFQLPSAKLGAPHLDPSQVPLPPSPDLLPSPMLEATPISQPSKRQCPFASPIPAEGARSWSQFPFPLLPLTTTPVQPCSHGEHQLNLKDFPFVCEVKLRISLPGPTSDDLYP
ncbi:Nn.00g107380.m01.CDS01 [Neocucurbitaria sp. VM-36]